jgi:hypothetical protein
MIAVRAAGTVEALVIVLLACQHCPFPLVKIVSYWSSELVHYISTLAWYMKLSLISHLNLLICCRDPKRKQTISMMKMPMEMIPEPWVFNLSLHLKFYVQLHFRLQTHVLGPGEMMYRCL